MDIGYCVCWYFGLNETVAFTILWLQTNFGARNAVSISWKFEQSSRRGKNPSSIQFWFLPEPPEGVGWAGLVAPELWFELTKGFGGGMWESSWHVLKQVSHRVSRLDRFPLWLLFCFQQLWGWLDLKWLPDGTLSHPTCSLEPPGGHCEEVRTGFARGPLNLEIPPCLHGP